MPSRKWVNTKRLKVSWKIRCNINTKIGLDLFKTAFSKQMTRIRIIYFVKQDMLSSFVYSKWVSYVKTISVRLNVKLKSLSREGNRRHLSLKIKTKSALLQDKLIYFNYSRVLDNHFTVMYITVDKLLTVILLILTQIRVW